MPVIRSIEYLATLDPADVAVTFVPIGMINGPVHAAVRHVAPVVR